MPAIKLVVSGHVQGVGFRYFVSRVATNLGIDGEVWNRPDRKVEAIAEHPEPKVLQEFAAQVWDGPGQVDDVLAEDTAVGLHNGFRISHGPIR